MLTTDLGECGYMLARMATPNHPIVLTPADSGRWSATMQMPDGPVTAIGDTEGGAKAALKELLVLVRALEVTRQRIDALTAAR